MHKTLVVIAGPTAVGKTALCVALAKFFDTEILSADARQFYQELNIGTAKPTPEEMQGVVHHFIDSHAVAEEYNAGCFEKEALQTLEIVFQKKDVAILTGGSGLYIKTLTDGMDEMPIIDPTIRITLNERLANEGLLPLLHLLRELDPVYFAKVDTANPQRVIRGLEVCLATGKPFSSFRNNIAVQRPFNIVRLCLERPREELYQRIDDRVDAMIANGLIAEVENLITFQYHNALQTVGYKEVFNYIHGNSDKSEMVRVIKRNTRHYAKRQLTWFRHQGNYTWFSADDFEGIREYLITQLVEKP